MTGNMAGRHRSPHRGSSVEFAEYRKYVPGDDTRRLDWKAYARSDRYYIKEFEADTNLRAYFVVDASGSAGGGAVRVGGGLQGQDPGCGKVGPGTGQSVGVGGRPLPLPDVELLIEGRRT